MNSEFTAILVAGLSSALTTTIVVFVVERRRLMSQLEDARLARIEAEEKAAYAQYAKAKAEEACLEAQDAALDAQQKYLALMERYRYNVVQCIQAGLQAIVMKRSND